MISLVKGKNLDRIAADYGLKRVRWFWIFRESDTSLKARLLQLLRGGPR